MRLYERLRRLDSVWIDPPVYLLTICTEGRRPRLASPRFAEIIIDELEGAETRHGWLAGRFVIMPDHMHVFVASGPEASDLSKFVNAFKQWTTKRLVAAGETAPIWQRNFHDHLLRARESYANKWLYVRENPVRAGLVTDASDWPYQGEIHPLEV